MHRATPLLTSFRAFSSGGARSVVDKVDDSTLLQEMAGNFMKGETRDKVEAPQNYGFSSVVLPAKKGKDGQIMESAEAIINFLGGSRSFPMCTMMDDRRHRPMGLKPGENAQYDDLGQMTLLRRAGLFLLSLDGEDESQQSGGASPKAESGGSGQTVERMVSMRHVEKKKQERQKPQAQAKGAARDLSPEAYAASQDELKSKHKDFKHEGETVNTEIRCTKKRISFYSGETEVGFYDKESATWHLKGTIILEGTVKLGSPSASKKVHRIGDTDSDGDTAQTGAEKVFA